MLSILLAVSVYFNIKPDTGSLWFLIFKSANTGPTYNTFHHIKEAQQLATGKGIKVGITGKYFGYSKNRDIYAGGKDFVDNQAGFKDIAEHGLWMATTLKEIAPNVEVYALNARDNNRDKESVAIVKAVDRAIENNLDVLTYSAEAFRDEDRNKIDKAVNKAIAKHVHIQ